MKTPVKRLKQLITQTIPGSTVGVDEPAQPGGIYWIDVVHRKKRQTIEYRPGEGFGFFQNDSGYGEGPAEIYRTPERAVRRLAQLLSPEKKDSRRMGLKNLRELYGQSQVGLAKRAGVKQPAISRFEKRGEVKLGTLAATIKALGGKLEVRAHFSDADIPISFSTKEEG